MNALHAVTLHAHTLSRCHAARADGFFLTKATKTTKNTKEHTRRSESMSSHDSLQTIAQQALLEIHQQAEPKIQCLQVGQDLVCVDLL